MIQYFTLSNNKIAPVDSSAGTIVVIASPTDEERQQLLQQTTIDEHTLASALDPDELSRLEFEADHTAIIFKRPRNYSGKDQLLFKVTSCGIFLFRDRLYLVMSEDIPLFDGKLFTTVHSLNELVLKLIFRSIYHFLEHLRIFTLITDELESKINTAMENKYLLNLFTLEKSLVYYLNSINSNGILIEKLKYNASKFGFTEDEIELLDDLNIENTQCYRQAEIHSNILASLMDARASIVGNNLNVLMKTLNIVMLGIMIPTFVVSVFSMNVPIPMQDKEYAFWIILVLALASFVAVVFARKKFKW
ncbi:MAG TPA: magnesium transporter CorA family protein [Bacteroidota bacterium]|jgi:magnesium transporter|nr:magnesium transporter CorA family protein [Bacteroidota bacterium]